MLGPLRASCLTSRCSIIWQLRRLHFGLAAKARSHSTAHDNNRWADDANVQTPATRSEPQLWTPPALAASQRRNALGQESLARDAPLAEQQLAMIHRSTYFDMSERALLRERKFKTYRPEADRSDSGALDHATEQLENLLDATRGMEPADALSMIKSERVGERTFAWLMETAWADVARWSRNFRLLSLLAHSLVAEDKEELVWQRIVSQARHFPKPKDAEEINAHSHALAWAPRLLRAVAHAHFERDIGRTSEQAVGVLRRLDELRHRFPPARCINKGALYTLFNHLWLRNSSAGLKTADRQTLDWYLTRYLAFHSRKTGVLGDMPPPSRIVYARLWVAHPYTPDTQYAMKILWDLDRGRIPRMAEPKTFAEETYMRHFVKAVSYQLRREGKVEEAEWVDGLTKKYFNRLRDHGRPASADDNTFAQPWRAR